MDMRSSTLISARMKHESKGEACHPSGLVVLCLVGLVNSGKISFIVCCKLFVRHIKKFCEECIFKLSDGLPSKGTPTALSRWADAHSSHCRFIPDTPFQWTQKYINYEQERQVIFCCKLFVRLSFPTHSTFDWDNNRRFLFGITRATAFKYDKGKVSLRGHSGGRARKGPGGTWNFGNCE